MHPGEFFTAGWHLVLTPAELVALLAICHVADLRLIHDGSAVMFLAERMRYSLLGLTEAYLSIHELDEFGLIRVVDRMSDRSRGGIQAGATGGKPPEPEEMSVPMFSGKPSTDALFTLDAFRKPAIDLAAHHLKDPLPRYARRRPVTPRAYRAVLRDDWPGDGFGGTAHVIQDAEFLAPRSFSMPMLRVVVGSVGAVG